MLPARGTRPRLVWCMGMAAAALFSGCYSSSGTQLPHPCTLTPPSPPDWRLQADGTFLRDGLGRVVFLRGVDAGGRSKFAPYVPFDYPSGQYAAALDAYMDRAASWGIDAMRVPFTWAALEPTQGQDDADWLSRYQQLLDVGVGPRHLDRRRLPPGRLLGELLRRRIPVLDHRRTPPRRTTTAPQLAARVLRRLRRRARVRRILGERLDGAERVPRRVGRDDHALPERGGRRRLRAFQRARRRNAEPGRRSRRRR